jgi:hypothetical protein
MDWPTASIIIAIVISLAGLILKFAPSSKSKIKATDNCNQDECNKKFDTIIGEVKTMDEKLELQNTDVQLLKLNHTNQEKVIDGLAENISKIFSKIDEIKTLMISSLNK